MKKLITLCMLLTLICMASASFAAGKLPYDRSGGKLAIQNLVGLSPDPAVSSCTTATKTKGTLVTVTNDGSHIGLKWTATSATGAPIVVKRRLNSNTAFMPESSGTVALNGAITTVPFDVFSSASGTATTLCVELQ